MGSNWQRPRRAGANPPITTPATPPATTPAAPAGPDPLGAPAGKVKALNDGTDWAAINQWDTQVAAASAEFGVPAVRVKAHLAIESRGVAGAIQRNHVNGDSFGLLQVVPRWWLSDINQLAKANYTTYEDAGQAMIHDPLLAVRAGCNVLAKMRPAGDTWDQASSMFFVGNPNWSGGDYVNGTTAAQYKHLLDALMAEIAAAQPKATTTTPAPTTQDTKPVPPKSTTPADPLWPIFRQALPPISYGWLGDVGLSYYQYGVGHGTDRATEHTGIDVPVPYDTPLYAPGDGVVVCRGAAGSPLWGEGCGAYQDYRDGSSGQTYGIGNITILLDHEYQGSPVKLVLGHCALALVGLGDRVTGGQQVGTSGGMNGAHCHVETAINRNGSYWLVDPRLALSGNSRTFPTAPGWITDAQIKSVFPDARPDGVRTLAWLAKIAATKTVPVFVEWTDPDTPQELGVFSDGSKLKVDGTWAAA